MPWPWPSAHPGDRLWSLAHLGKKLAAERKPHDIVVGCVQRVMASTLYESIFEKGEARGRTAGKAEQCADTIIRILIRRMGALDPALATRIRSVSSIDTLEVWLSEALDLPDAESAHRLVDKIGKAALS